MGPSTVTFTPEFDDQVSRLAITSRGRREPPLIIPAIRSLPPLEVHLDDTIMVRSADDPDSDPVKTECSFNMLSWETEEMVTYAKSGTHNHVPVALYQGLVWWSMNGSSLIPTIVDLNRPGVVYYKPERVIDTGQKALFTQGNRSRYSPQFVQATSESADNADFINLETGTITSVVPPQSSSFGRVFAGFVYGNFAPRYISKEVAEMYDDLVAEREGQYLDFDD